MSKKQKAPAFQFYYRDYIHGTRFFTFEEKGAYLDILCEQADLGHLHIDTIMIALRRKPELWEIIKEKFVQDSNGLWYNERLDEVIEKRQRYSESRKTNLFSSHMEEHMGQHMEDEEEDEVEDRNKKEEKAKIVKVDKLEELHNKMKELDLELALYKGQYPDEMLKAFFDYWSEPNKSGTKIRKDLEKTWDTSRRLKTWDRNNKNFNRGNNGNGTTKAGRGAVNPEQLLRVLNED